MAPIEPHGAIDKIARALGSELKLIGVKDRHFADDRRFGKPNQASPKLGSALLNRALPEAYIYYACCEN